MPGASYHIFVRERVTSAFCEEKERSCLVIDRDVPCVSISFSGVSKNQSATKRILPKIGDIILEI